MRREAFFPRRQVIEALRCEAVMQGLDVPPSDECGIEFKMDNTGRNLMVVLTWEA